MQIETVYHFPCGYEYKIKVKSSFFDFMFVKTKGDVNTVCPMHKENCKKGVTQ